MIILERGLEFVAFFIIIFVIYYFSSIKKCKKNKKYVPVEVNLIIMKHKIDIKKIDLYKMIKTVCLTTSLILSFSVVFTSFFISNLVISLLFSLALALILAVIIYNYIGIYYKKKEKSK